MAEVEYDYFKPAQRLRRLLRKERRTISLIFFYAVLNGIIAMTLPLGIQAIVNYILGGRVTSSWVLLIVVVILGVAISGIFQIAQVTYTEKLQQRIFAKSSFEFAVRLTRIKMSAIQNRYAPEMVNQFFDTVTLQKGLAKLLLDYPMASLQIFFGLALISIYHPFFLIFSASVILLIYLVFKFSGPSGVTSSLQESTEKYKIAHWLEELARSIGTFKLAGVTGLPLARVDQLILAYLKFRRKHFGILIAQFKVMIGFKVVTTAALLIMGSILLVGSEISLGQFVAAEIIIIMIMSSIEKLIVGLESVYDVLTSLEKLGAITDLPLEDEDRATAIPNGSGGFRISLENMSYRFPNKDSYAVKDLSMEIAAGEKLILSGGSGSGKSTLMQLITGVYDNYEGHISINDLPVTAIRLDHLRKHIGDNLWQETIFKGTIRENISLGKEEVTDAMVLEALDAVGAIQAVNRLPSAIETLLLSEGMGMPRSLIRKIILARSIVSSSKLLLLEMETSYFTQEEKQIFCDYILSKPWTVLMATHDHLYMEAFDNIAYLEDGKLMQQGDYTHFKNSEYARYIR